MSDVPANSIIVKLRPVKGSTDGSKELEAYGFGKNIAIVKGFDCLEDAFIVIHRHSGYRIAITANIEDALTVATCVKALDWSWDKAEEMPATTKDDLEDILVALCRYIGFRSDEITFEIVEA